MNKLLDQSYSHSRVQKSLFLAFLILLPTIVSGECTSDAEEEGHNKRKALGYKLIAIATILVASAIGIGLPVLSKTIPSLSPDRDLFFVIKAFAAGVILGTGFIHVLPDGFDHLTNPCLNENPWRFPFAGFVAMVSAMGTLMVDSYATSYYKKSHLNRAGRDEEMVVDGHAGHVHVHTHATHGHAHGSILSEGDLDASELLRHRVISQVLELGIIVHSVIIGITLGVSESPKHIKPLVAALTFHQFFEGMGLGGCIAQAKFKSRAVVIMAVFFSLTTPIGIVIGIGITNGYKENSPTALIVEGVLNAASAGILIYTALVDLLSADFMSPRMQNNGKLQLQANASLLFGAGFMSLLGKWA